MLIRAVLANRYTYRPLPPHKRSLQTIDPSSSTRLGWFSLPASVPMWGTFLSEPLSIVGLVGRYPANCLMERMPIHQRIAPLTNIPMRGPCFMRH